MISNIIKQERSDNDRSLHFNFESCFSITSPFKKLEQSDISLGRKRGTKFMDSVDPIFFWALHNSPLLLQSCFFSGSIPFWNFLGPMFPHFQTLQNETVLTHLHSQSKLQTRREKSIPFGEEPLEMLNSPKTEASTKSSYISGRLASFQKTICISSSNCIFQHLGSNSACQSCKKLLRIPQYGIRLLNIP